MQSKSSQLTHPKQHPSLLMYVQYALSLVVCTAWTIIDRSSEISHAAFVVDGVDDSDDDDDGPF